MVTRPTLSKSHSRANKKDRVPARGGSGAPTCPDKYAKAERTIDEVYVAIANGGSKSDILQGLCLGNYHNNPCTKRNAYHYYNAAMDRFAVDCDIEADRLRQMFYGRYEALLEDAVAKGDIYNARGILDSMSRIFGIEKKNPETAIQINGKDDGSVVVNFGLGSGGDGD